MSEEQIDLFTVVETLPQEVQDILNEESVDWDGSYDNCRRLEQRLNAVGYGIEWGLDAEPFNLHKL